MILFLNEFYSLQNPSLGKINYLTDVKLTSPHSLAKFTTKSSISCVGSMICLVIKAQRFYLKGIIDFISESENEN